jgi:hypothetical protein
VDKIYINSYFIIATIRRLSIPAISLDPSGESFNRCDLVSYADTSMVGFGFVMIGDSKAHVTVHGSSRDLSLSNIPIGSAVTVWICPATGQPYLFLEHESLFMGDRMTHSLLCPNQLV